MTDPSTDPDLIEHLDDDTLLRAHEVAQRLSSDVAVAALVMEIERRGLVV